MSLQASPESPDWRKPEAQNSCIAGIEAYVQLLQQNPNQFDGSCFVSMIGLLQAGHHAGRNLITGWRECDVPLLAWATRNSLETAIWLKYVTQSKENAERFYRDWLNDAEDALLRAIQLDQHSRTKERQDTAYADLTFDTSAPGKAANWIAARRKEHQFPPQRRLDIRKVAKAIGEDHVFTNLNPILSKYIHATSFSVLSFPTEASMRRTALMFLDQGFWNLARVIGITDTFLKTRNLPSPIFP